LEKKLPNLEVVVVALMFVDEVVVKGVGFKSGIGRLGRFFSLLLSGLASLNDIVAGGNNSDDLSGVKAGMPTGTGADEPENHEDIPALDLSANFIPRSLSPVKEGIYGSTSTISGQALSPTL
jgi:hypothetical protein